MRICSKLSLNPAYMTISAPTPLAQRRRLRITDVLCLWEAGIIPVPAPILLLAVFPSGAPAAEVHNDVVSQTTLCKHNRGILCQCFPLSHDAAIQNTDILITYCNEGERMLAHQKCCKNVAFFKLATLLSNIKYFAIAVGTCWDLTSFSYNMRTVCRYSEVCSWRRQVLVGNAKERCTRRSSGWKVSAVNANSQREQREQPDSPQEMFQAEGKFITEG